MLSRSWFLAIFLLLATALGGCETATSVPAGAQQVHVDATGADVRLDRSTVHAGDVYLVVDLPPQGASLALIRGGSQPLTDADLARFAKAGDTEGMVTEGIDNSCCGKVHKETMAAGKYAFILHADRLAPGIPPSAITVLEVTP
jgi:hypothetical protein